MWIWEKIMGWSHRRFKPSIPFSHLKCSTISLRYSSSSGDHLVPARMISWLCFRWNRSKHCHEDLLRPMSWETSCQCLSKSVQDQEILHIINCYKHERTDLSAWSIRYDIFQFVDLSSDPWYSIYTSRWGTFHKRTIKIPVCTMHLYWRFSARIASNLSSSSENGVFTNRGWE